MIRQLAFLCVFSMTSHMALAQEPSATPPVYGMYIAQGHVECENDPGVSEPDSEIAASCSLAHDIIEARLKASFGTCSDGSAPIYIREYCVPYQMMVQPTAPLAPAQANRCLWTVKLIYTFASGERAGVQESRYSYCAAYRAAWASLLCMAAEPKYGPICAGTGRCIAIAPRCCCPPQPCAPQYDACGQRRGMWFRRRH